MRTTMDDLLHRARRSARIPPAVPYRPSYTYHGVHNMCSKDGTTCHEVFVPGVDSVIGAGDALFEALKEAQIKLTIM